MSKRSFLLLIIEQIKEDSGKNDKNWRGTLSSWIKC